MRYNGLHLLIAMALQKVDSPDFARFADALTLGAIREDIDYSARRQQIVEHWSLTHFSGPLLGGGFIPGLTRSAPAQAQRYFDAALAVWRGRKGVRTDVRGMAPEVEPEVGPEVGPDLAATARAFVLLGHASHLLIDMACPVHAWRVAHWSDGYEWYVESHLDELKSLPFALAPAFASVRANVAALACATRRFAPDRTHHHWGRWLKRRGWRQSLSQAELAAQARVLIPLAAGHLAAMYRQFVTMSGADADAQP
jgi:hypothetical protein